MPDLGHEIVSDHQGLKAMEILKTCKKRYGGPRRVCCWCITRSRRDRSLGSSSGKVRRSVGSSAMSTAFPRRPLRMSVRRF